MANEAALTVKPGLIDRAGERVERGLSRILRRLPPRVSLVTGGALLLVTLYLPTVHYFPDPGRGFELLLKDRAAWPGLMGGLFPHVGRAFYTGNLGLAVVTILLVFASLPRAAFLTKQALNRILFALAGTAALFFISDAFLILLALSIPSDGWFGFGETPEAIVVWAAFVLSCSCPAFFWPRRFFFLWAALMAMVTSSMFFPSAPEYLPLALFLYLLIPLVLWYRNAFSKRDEVRNRWPQLRRGITVLYIPAVLCDCAFIPLFGLWGLFAYLVGIALIALGYMQLAREAETTRASTPVPIPRPAIADS